MIPYIDIPRLHVWGPLWLEPFGLLVSIGCIVGCAVARWYAIRSGLDAGYFGPRAIVRLAAYVLVPAFLLSHWTAMALYFPERIHEIFTNPFRISPMSSYGGFLGAALGTIVYWQRTKLPRKWEYADALVVGWLAGWFFGRLGCTIVHDHPGSRSDFFMAVLFPDGPRHDLGLYEWLFTIVLNIVVLSLPRKHLRPGSIVGIVSVSYAIVRFPLDFLRVGDKLYLGLTPGQYFSVVLLLAGLWVLFAVWRGESKPVAR